MIEENSQKNRYEIINVTKRYPGTVALSDVNVSFKDGEIHGIIGKNGAGKSTLVNIMYGAEEPTRGQLKVCGKKILRLSPEMAHRLKISLVPQKTNYPLDLTVSESLFLGNYPRNIFGLIDNKKLIKSSINIFKKLGLNIDPQLSLRRLSLEDRRLIEVGRALWCFDSKVLILDETTAALSIKPKKMLFDILRKAAKEENRTVIFITHRLEEILEICDRVSVLRDGKIVSTVYRRQTDGHELARLITGYSDEKKNRKTPIKLKNKVKKKKAKGYLTLENVYRKGQFKDINFSVSPGEILGLAGMVGSGTNQLLRYMAGLSPENSGGNLIINGKTIIPKSPEQMMRNSVAYLTNNREEEGLFHNLAIENNMMGSRYIRYSNKLGLVKHKLLKDTVLDKIQQLQIKVPDHKSPIDVLSGGNKQKVMVARLLNYKPLIYLLDEVTEGIDIEARKILLNFIREKISKDSIVVTASNVVSDLIEISDRIVVMFHGSITKIFEREDFNEHHIYSALQGLEIK